nr:MAG: hypothetical protein DIU58_17475 [Sphaerobacter thermophilus]
MRHVMILMLLALPARLSAQGTPGTNISIDVLVGPVTRHGDTISVQYVLRSQPQSVEPLFHYTVDAPAPVVAMTHPDPKEDWATFTEYRGRSIAEWTVLGDEMQPGDTSPPLGFRAIGLPTIVTYWVRGYTPPPPLGAADTLPVVAPSDPLTENSVPGKTVGVEPFPSDLTPPALLRRIQGLLGESCSLGWVASGTCPSLAALLQQASTALGVDDIATAIARLDAFVAELESGHQTGSGAVNAAAYWLLRINAEFIRERLEALSPGLTEWAPGIDYKVGDEVRFQEMEYRCRQAHRSQVGWEPPNVYALWARVVEPGGLLDR